jgi:membrane protein
MAGETWQVLRGAVQGFIRDRAGRMGASLAFFTALSLAPFFIFAVSLAGLLLDQTQVRAEVMRHVGALVGRPGVRVTELLFDNALDAYAASSGIFATGLGMVVLLFAASAVLHELRDALNSIFRAAPPVRGWLRTALERFVSVALVFSLGFLLAVSLLFSTALGAFSARAQAAFPLPAALFAVLDVILNVGLTGLLFAFLYRYLPNVSLRWRDVLPGAALSAAVFTFAKWAFGVFLGNSLLATAYGAAGSLVVFLLWVFFTAQLFFFGAEVVKVRYRQRVGDPE